MTTKFITPEEQRLAREKAQREANTRAAEYYKLPLKTGSATTTPALRDPFQVRKTHKNSTAGNTIAGRRPVPPRQHATEALRDKQVILSTREGVLVKEYLPHLVPIWKLRQIHRGPLRLVTYYGIPIPGEETTDVGTEEIL